MVKIIPRLSNQEWGYIIFTHGACFRLLFLQLMYVKVFHFYCTVTQISTPNISHLLSWISLCWAITRNFVSNNVTSLLCVQLWCSRSRTTLLKRLWSLVFKAFWQQLTRMLQIYVTTVQYQDSLGIPVRILYWWFTTLVLGPCQLPWWEPPSHHSLLLWTWTCLTVTLLRQEEIILGKNFEILYLHTNLDVMDCLYYTHLPQLWHWSVCYLLWARTQQQPW